MDLETVIYMLVAFLHITTGAVPLSSIPEEGASLPNAESDSRSPSGAPSRPRRFKRCSCSSLMDKECVYFCHLDIIWINTPERTVPYGLGGPRMKRSVQDTESILQSADRCMCAKHLDKKCMDFCQTAGDLSSVPISHDNEERKVHQAIGCNGLRLGLCCIQKQLLRNKKLKRSEKIKQSLVSSFAFASLMNSINEKKDETHPRTLKKRELWRHSKTIS